MNEQKFAIDILKERYRDEVEFAGDANTTDIVKFIFGGEAPENVVRRVSVGQPLTFIEAITLLAATVSIIKNLIDIYRVIDGKIKTDEAKAIMEETWKRLPQT